MNKSIFWLIVIAAMSALVYWVSAIIAPFVISIILAYLLQPAINSFSERLLIPRGLATFLVFSLFISVFILILVLVLPVIYDQSSIFIAKIPNYKRNFDSLVAILVDKISHLDPEITNKVSEALRSFANNLFATISSFANHLWVYTVATFNFFVLIALVPIILYYFLKDWPKMMEAIESVLPIKEKGKVREIVCSINDLLSAYIRGQLNICLIVSTYYFICFWLVGVDLALLLALVSGFLIIIPFIGTLVSFLLVSITCYFTFGASSEMLYISAIFIVGNIVEGYILSPRIIGNRIGLHPVWIMFAVFAGASLFGFVGVLFAIPMAGIIRLLIGHLIIYYKTSKFYKS